MPLNCGALALPRTRRRASCHVSSAHDGPNHHHKGCPHLKLHLGVQTKLRLLPHRLRNSDLAFAGNFHLLTFHG